MDANSTRMSNYQEPAPPGTSPPNFPSTPKPLASTKGVENAKKRLRAFSIQKKTTPLSPIVPKPISTGTTTVLIGKLSGVKPTPKIEEDPLKKLPRPPKPGAARKCVTDSYSDQQKRTLSEIEDMKRKMELVDLGIPLGLICPTSTDEKAMPTKAMPPIKTFLDPAKVDELIREAKKAKVEGREFKFDYQKILPDYDNPFQRKRDDVEKDNKYDRRKSTVEKRDKHEFRRYSDHRRDERDKYKERSKDKSKEKLRSAKEHPERETDVNLKDYLVCDSWSENDDKTNSSSPKHVDTGNVSVKKTPEKTETGHKLLGKTADKIVINISKEPSEYFKGCQAKKDAVLNESTVESPNNKPSRAFNKLQPVIDCFKFEIDPNDEEILDIFDESSGLEKYSQVKPKTSFYVSPAKETFDHTPKDISMDGMNDDTFLESVINEIRQDDNMCDETSQDKRLVEYDESPSKDDYDSPVVKRAKERKRASLTPEMDEKMKEQTRRRNNSDKKESSKQKNDSFNRKEPTSQRSEYSDRTDHGSQRSEYSDRKDADSQRSYYSNKNESSKQKIDLFNRKEPGSQRSEYSDRTDQSSQRSEYSDRKDTDSHRSYYSDKKESSKQKIDSFNRKEPGSQRSEYSDRMDHGSQRSNYSDGRQSTESGYKTSDTNKSDNKYVDNFRLSVEKELDEALERSMNRCTVESLETWSFVLKICQPLLFRHDKNKCYRETSVVPKIWYTENPKMCSCVKDRAVVYEELEMLKMALVDRVYGCDQLADTPSTNARAWYPRSAACLAEGRVQPVAVDWEADDSQGAQAERPRRSLTPQREDEIMLDREYQRFMEAVWPDVAEAKPSETSRSTTPVRQEARRKKKEDVCEREAEDKKTKKIKLSSEGWSQESDIDEESEKTKKNKMKDKEKSRKRKRSTSTLSSMTDSDGSSKKKRKMMKVKSHKKAKSREAKRRRMGKKLLKKLKEKQKQKKKTDKEESEDLDMEEVKKKEVKKSKKRKQQKLKKKSQKRRRKASSTTDFTTTTSGSDSEPGGRSSKSKKRKRTEGKKKKRDKRQQSSSESHSEDLFDVNILNNIKTERLTDDEKCQKLMEFSPRIHHKPREIINVKELQNDFVGNNNILIKQEVEETKAKVEEVAESEKKETVEEDNSTQLEDREEIATKLDSSDMSIPLPVSPPPVVDEMVEKTVTKVTSLELSSNQPIHLPELPEDAPTPPIPPRVVDESNLSQCSSQESVCSVKETSSYEKDESHLRPSSQNSNYSFNDVIASQSALYHKGMEVMTDGPDGADGADGPDGVEGYDHEPGSYEMYEHMAMAYQSDVASLDAGAAAGPQRIETVVRVRARGEIKCDWRADHPPAAPPANRPSRWGLKPSEVNIVLTGGEQDAPTAPPPPAPPLASPAPPAPVYRIQSLANRTDVAADYDEAYMDMYGASDRLQYGDCFSTDPSSVAHMAPLPAVTDVAMVPLPSSPTRTAPPGTRSTLDARIDQALRDAAISEMAAAAAAAEEQKDLPEKGILITGAASGAARGGKRVSFADGYQPGQDSDLEEPPVKKRRKARRTGCAWPCPAAHPDHVPLWDALPPPPPPPGDPPPRAARPPRSCRQAMRRAPPADGGSILGGFMPPEPPPGLISF